MKTLTIPEIAAFLLQQDKYVMLTHRRPDGDTIGSAVALCRGLRALGKTAHVLENPQFTPKFRPYLDGLTVETVPENAVLVAVDIAAEQQLSLSAADYVNQITLLLDHHESRGEFARMGYVDASRAACGEIVLDVLRALNAPIDRAAAEALYVALSTDTGCLRYSNTTADTLRAAAFCKDCGADTFAINRIFFMTKRRARLRLEAYLTETTAFFADGRVAVSALPDRVRAELGIVEDDIDDISGFGREIEGVEIAVMLRNEGENTKLSVRSSPAYNSAAICARLGGGGHRAAAGATVAGDMEAAKATVLQAIAAEGVAL